MTDNSTSTPAPRQVCVRCRKAAATCYCALVRPFRPFFDPIILIHRDESRRGVATGRMAHLCLEGSSLIEGTDFSHDERVNRILDDRALWPVVLYPTPDALDIGSLPPSQRLSFAPPDKRLAVFIIDGTWATARKMWRLSRNLHPLPVIRFTPREPSAFQVRQQPRAECLSTLEAIHQLIDLLSPDAMTRPHDNLLEVFGSMVRTQLEYAKLNNFRCLRGARR